MMIAFADEEGEVFRQLIHSELIKVLKQLSANMKLSAFRKHPRRPKKPAVKRKSDPMTPQVWRHVWLCR